jgi:hypothetical protein
VSVLILYVLLSELDLNNLSVLVVLVAEVVVELVLALAAEGDAK